MNVLKKPSVFIIIILLSVIGILTMQFSSLQHQIESMGKQVNSFKTKEDRLNGKVNSLHTEMDHVRKEEHELKIKE